MWGPDSKEAPGIDSQRQRMVLLASLGRMPICIRKRMQSQAAQVPSPAGSSEAGVAFLNLAAIPDVAAGWHCFLVRTNTEGAASWDNNQCSRAQLTAEKDKTPSPDPTCSLQPTALSTNDPRTRTRSPLSNLRSSNICPALRQSTKEGSCGLCLNIIQLLNQANKHNFAAHH